MFMVWNWCYHSLLAFWNPSEYSLPISVEIWNFLFFKIDKEPQLLYAEVGKTPISYSYKVEPQQQTVGNRAEPQNWIWKSVHNNNENGSDRNPESVCFAHGYLALLRDLDFNLS